MADYVSKEQLEEFFKGVTITVTGRTRGEAIRAAYAIEVLKAVYNGVMKLPTTDAVPVRHGHWIVEWETDDTRMLRCSECRMVFNVGKGRDGNYCPECGARMDEVEHS